MDGMGLSNALEQQQNITQSGIQMNNQLQDENNAAMRDFKTQLTTLTSDDNTANDTNLAKIGGYTIAGLEKIHEYKEGVKSGAVGEGFMGTKLVSRSKKLGGWLTDKANPSPEAHIAPEEDLYESHAARIQANIEAAGASEDAAADPLSLTGRGVAPEELGGSTGASLSEPGSASFDHSAVEDTGSTGGEASEGGSTLATDAGKSSSTIDEVAGEGGSILSRVVPGAIKGVEVAGKVVGGLASLAVLGDDIGNQISKHKVFYGENTGDNVGNLTNEIGSAIDVAGVATGDPFLIMAGVGVGAVGSLVSDVSEFFHHKHEEAQKKAAPPPKIAPVAQTDIASAGYIAQSAPSTLKQVQVGAS